MKKVKNFLLGNIKTVVAFIIGLIISGTGVYAATILFASNQVSYDNTSSGLAATNVQDALDELYQKAASIPKIYYAFGNPTTSSTTDYTTLNKNVFVALNGTQKSVCIIRKNKLHCFDNNNFNYEKWHIQGVFNDISCNVDSSRVSCNASDFYCYVGSNGLVYCDDNSSGENCRVSGAGSVGCG